MLKSNLYVVLVLLLRLSGVFEVSSALTTSTATATEVTCIDRDADILTSPNFIYATDISKEICENEQDCVPEGPLVGEDEDLTHRGFVVVTGMANLGHQIKWFRPSPDTTSEYLYLRYYVHKVPRTPSMFRVNGALGSAALLDVTLDGRWKEGCFPIRHDSFEYRSLLVYSGVPDGEEYLALDKIILVAPIDGSPIACSPTEVEEIKEFCRDEFFPPTTTTTTTTTTSTTTSSTSTSTSSTTTTERTSPGTSTTSSTTITTEKATSPSEVPPTNPGDSSTTPSTEPTESDQGTTTTTTKKPSKNTTTKIAIYVGSAIGLLVLALVASIAYSKCRSPTGSKVNKNVIESAGPDMTAKQKSEFTDSGFPANNGKNYFSNNFKTRQPKFDSQKV